MKEQGGHRSVLGRRAFRFVRSSLIWDVIQLRLVVSDVSGHAVGPHLRGLSSCKPFIPQLRAEIANFVSIAVTRETEVVDTSFGHKMWTCRTLMSLLARVVCAGIVHDSRVSGRRACFVRS
jgi:hypothetical protein